MAIIAWQDVTQAFSGDPQSLVIYWGPFQAGDEGEPIPVHAYPFVSWQLTGYPEGGNKANPNVPIAANRTITVLATNDLDCWGPLFTLNGDAAGINARNGDPMRSGFPDQQFVRVKPVAGGSVNGAGPDCGLLLFCPKQFGPRI